VAEAERKLFQVFPISLHELDHAFVIEEVSTLVREWVLKWSDYSLGQFLLVRAAMPLDAKWL